MKIILCMLIDSQGHIKYVPQYFKPNEVDVCVSNLRIGNIGNNTVFYDVMEFVDGMDICWTTYEVFKQLEPYNTVKIFTKINNFYDKCSEIQFAFINELEEYDETVDMDTLKDVCKNMHKEYLGEKNNIKFFRYTVDK